MSKKSFMLPALLACLIGPTYASENKKSEQIKINQSFSNNKNLPPLEFS